MFEKKVVKRCPKGHEMDVSWRRCPRCTGQVATAASARAITDQTIIATPEILAADETRIFTPSVSRAAPALPPPPPPPPPKVRVALKATAGPLTGQELTLEPGVHKVGKSPQEAPDVRVIRIPEDRYMSKEHATLTLGTVQLVLTDPGSTNGTFVNGERVSRALLKDGDELRLGESIFRVILER